MNHDWAKILAMTGVFLGPILAIVSVISRFFTRKYRLLLNLLFIPALCVPVALLILAPKLGRTYRHEQHMKSRAKHGPWPSVEGEKHLDRQMIVRTVLLIMYWVTVVVVVPSEMHHLLYKAERSVEARRSILWILGLGSLSSGVAVGWMLVGQAVAKSRAGLMATSVEDGSWAAFWVDAALYLVCWGGMVCVLMIPMRKLQDRIYRDARLGDGATIFTESDTLLENEH